MKVGKSVHVDPGAVTGVLLAFVGALPEILANPAVKCVVPPWLGHTLIVAGVVIAATRGQIVRREQYRGSEVAAGKPDNDVDPAKVEYVERPKFPRGT